MTWDEVSFLQKGWIKRTAWILANLFTLSNITLAILGIVYTFIQPENFNIWFAKIIAVCGILDFADGKLARISGSRKLAVDVDTIVDAFAFGVLPAIYLGFTVSQWKNNIQPITIGWSILLGVITGLIYIGAVWFRLYRFVRRDPLYTPYFNGLPSPFAGMVIACLVTFENTQEWVIVIATVIIAGFMLSKIPFPSFKGVPSKFDLFWIISTALLVFLFAAFPPHLMLYPTYGIAVYMIIYLTASPGYAMKLEEKMKEKETEKEDKEKQ
jgi:phosphatidylserine synthase